MSKNHKNVFKRRNFLTRVLPIGCVWTTLYLFDSYNDQKNDKAEAGCPGCVNLIKAFIVGTPLIAIYFLKQNKYINISFSSQLQNRLNQTVYGQLKVQIVDVYSKSIQHNLFSNQITLSPGETLTYRGSYKGNTIPSGRKYLLFTTGENQALTNIFYV